jgi:hypothetical protein
MKYHLGKVYVKNFNEIDFGKVVKIYKKLGLKLFNGCKDRKCRFINAEELRLLVKRNYDDVALGEEGKEASNCYMTFNKCFDGRIGVSIDLNVLYDNNYSNNIRIKSIE